MKKLCVALITIPFLYGCPPNKKVTSELLEKQDSIVVQKFNAKEETTIVHTERYGSVCCPKDIMHNNHITDYILKFEEEHHVKISDTYKLITGKEGEGIYYLSLNGITTDQKVIFLANRQFIATPELKITAEDREEILKQIQNPKLLGDYPEIKQFQHLIKVN